jgi:hypothetical protein
LSGGLLSLKGSGELKCRLKPGGGGVKAVDDVFWDMGSWLQLLVVVVELCQRGFRCSQSANFRAGSVTVLMFCCSFFIIFI